ncbi:MAG: translocation/assembly module TamB domain-containing protein [Candidatus Eremiobacteraeota bacterium]|nr:translocation/assembly module TamB domain-containing protein [Candidatus Eremiobacteraeota bacterium]
MDRYRNRKSVALGLVLLGIVLAVAFRAPLVRAGLAAAIDLATGYRVSFESVHLRWNGATAEGVDARRGADDVLHARRLALGYSLRDLLPGGKHRYGLRDLALSDATLTVIRRPDGTFNVGGGTGATAAPGLPAPGAGTPLVLNARVEGLNVIVLDPYRVATGSRKIALRDIRVSAVVDTAGVTKYSVRGALSTSGAPQPQAFRAQGLIDRSAGYGVHHLRIARLPVRDLVNYVVNSESTQFFAGIAKNVDLRAYALDLAGKDPSAYHIAGSAYLDGAVLRVPGLQHTLRNLQGRLDVYDGGVAAPHLDATLVQSPVRIAGALFGWSQPQLYLGIHAIAPLRELRTLFAFSKNLDLTGDAELHALVEGPAADPLIVARFAAPNATFLQYPLHDTSGVALYYQNSVTLVPARTHYGPISVVARGTLDLGKTANSHLIIEADAPARSLPYLAQIMPYAPLHLSALIEGGDLALNARGIVSGAGGDDSFSGMFHVDAHGDGQLGPFTVARSDGSSLAGTFYLNRSASESGFWLDARHFRLTESAPPHVTLPGLPSLAPPDFDGVLDGSIAGQGTPSNFYLAGRIHGSGIVYGKYAIDDLDARIAGAPGDVRLGTVTARGTWGRFSGQGALEGSRLALEGNYAGSFDDLRPFTGDLGARGPIDGPVAAEFGPDRTVVQARGASSRGATVHGVPVDRLDGTLALVGKRLDIYAATADVGGGTFAAAGSLGGGRTLGVSLAGVKAASVGAAGSALQAGTLAAIGSVAYEAGGTPTFDGGVALDRGRVRSLGVTASGDVVANANTLTLADTDALLGSAYGVVGGTVRGFGGGRPAYDLTVAARDVPLAAFARVALPKRHDIAGTLDANLAISGAGMAPTVSGNVALSEGTFNGQAFHDARADIRYVAGMLAARRGAIVVGSTRAAFDADLHGADATLNLNVPHADLADFDDLFDTGDTLGGKGRIVGSFVKAGDAIRSQADVAIAGLRYRRFDLGDAVARWSGRGSQLDTHIAFGGISGRLEANGTVALARHSSALRLLQRSSFDGTAKLTGLDLGVWLPVLGYRAPVVGRIDGDARLHGPLENPDLHLTASMLGGIVGKYPIDRAVLTLDSDLHRAIVRAAEVDVANVALTASGTFGFRANDPLQLALHAKTPNVGVLGSKFVGAQFPMTGMLEADVRIDGPRSKPRVNGGFDLEQATLHGVAVTRGLGEIALEGRTIVLTGGEINFARGSLLLAGSVPLTLDPFGFGPASAPLGLELAAKGIDLTNFAPLLPHNSTLKGQLDGRVALTGKVSDPQLVGELSLAGGALQSPYERVPLTNMAAKVSFTSKTIALESLHADAGAGTLDATGNATVPDLVRPGADATYAVHLRANKMQLDLPTFGRGQVDGTVAITHAPGKPALIGGNATLSNAVIPFSALLLASGGSSVAGFVDPTAAAGPARPDVAFALDVAAGNNVRVRSGNVDLGGKGKLSVGGSLVSGLQLSGAFDSTGGTLSYFNTVFRVQNGTVTFSPDQGVIPSLDAVAITHVINPDPNAARNPTGSADITLDVTGPVTQMNIALSSDPTYDRQTILGLLLNAPAIGATNIFNDTGTGVPSGVAVNRGSGELSVAQEAFGILNAQFTRNLLAPVETTLGGALGLSNLAFNLDYGGGFGLSARKVLGKRMDIIYAQTFSYPYRQMFGFDIRPNDSIAAQFTVFQTLGSQGVGAFTPIAVSPFAPGNQRITASVPSGGTSGFSFSLQRLFP